MKKIIVARMNHDGKEYVGKREVDTYDGSDAKTVDANVGLTLRNQREIRQKLAEKYGIKSVSVGGKSVDTSDIEEV